MSSNGQPQWLVFAVDLLLSWMQEYQSQNMWLESPLVWLQRLTERKISKHVVLTDIIGAEDHFGDMDFKVCGTRDGVTGFQLDLKIQGLPFDIAKEAIVR